MTKFEKPESRDWQYWDMVKEAGGAALTDAGIAYGDVQQVPVGYCFQASTAGQRAVYELGLTGVPVYNVNNNCATGSTALMMARQFVEGGVSDCVLAVGFEKMQRGARSAAGADAGADFKTSPVARHYGIMAARHGFEMSPPTAQIFGDAARGTWRSTARPRPSSRRSAPRTTGTRSTTRTRGSRTRTRSTRSRREGHPHPAHQAPVLADPRRRGGGRRRLRTLRRGTGPGEKAVEIVAQAMTTDTEESFASGSCVDVVGQPMSRAAARQVYEASGTGIDGVDVVELHGCFSVNELLAYEALGMCGEGESGKLVESGATTYGGRGW